MPLTTTANILAQVAGPDAMGNLPETYWELVDRYRGDLVNQALAILGNLEEAEDAVQETFCEAFRHAEKLAQARSLGAWLRSINRANALNRLSARRRESQNRARRQRMDPERTATTGGFSLLELRELVAQAVENLPSEMREVITLRHWSHLSYPEIAQRLHLPVSTVWRLYYDASMRLHEKMKAHLHAAPLLEHPEASARDSMPDLSSGCVPSTGEQA